MRTWVPGSVRTACRFWKRERSRWWLQSAVTLPTRSFFRIPSASLPTQNWVVVEPAVFDSIYLNGSSTCQAMTCLIRTFWDAK